MENIFISVTITKTMKEWRKQKKKGQMEDYCFFSFFFGMSTTDAALRFTPGGTKWRKTP